MKFLNSVQEKIPERNIYLKWTQWMKGDCEATSIYTRSVQKWLLNIKLPIKWVRRKKKPSQSQSSSERGNYLEEPPTLNCLLATVKQYGGVTIKTHAFRWMEHSKVTAHITRDQWKLMPVEQNHMQGKWGCLVIFNARSIWMTGLKGWSMALAGCNEDQLTSSRKQLIVSIPDKWHPELLLLK